MRHDSHHVLLPPLGGPTIAPVIILRGHKHRRTTGWSSPNAYLASGRGRALCYVVSLDQVFYDSHLVGFRNL